MAFIVCIAALCFLMFVAYRGYSVILFAPVAALLAVLLTEPKAVLPVYSSLFMAKMVVFVQNYFPVFMLGAIFGKVIELSGFAKSIVHSVVKLLGPSRAMLSIVTVCALLTYGGVSLFVVVFAVYPFAVELFRELNIPKRLIPGTIAMGAFTFTMDSLPGTPQIQNIIPTTFFKTNAYAAPILGTCGAVFILAIGMSYLEWQRRKALKAGEGYGVGHINEPEPMEMSNLPNPLLSISPLFVVGIMNIVFTRWVIPSRYGDAFTYKLSSGMHDPITVKVASFVGVWAVEAALVLGILTVVLFGWRRIGNKFAEGTKNAIGGALLASMNTASEYGFGSVISALPGFVLVSGALAKIPNPLIKEAVSVNILAGITGSASGGMGIALAAMSQQFIDAANAMHIPLEVLHRVAAMASGGMDTLPHNGAVITLLAVTGLTHKQSYKDIFAVTCIKTTACFAVIALYYLTHLV
ncbi:MAG TPA: GntP family permease [candidate division Zixibacteria bacterium]|nr:GntP family permease [candidate division Zixibacteria bacterium]